MSEQMIIEQCSPTLAGLKTANLFPCRYDSKDTLWNEIRIFNRMLSHKGVRLLPIRAKDNFALIYLYRPERLKSDISNELSSEILQMQGYSSTDMNSCIVELIRRFRDYSEFPHEIGLFLGYPPEDVKGFIEHRGNDCKCIGCWKVYGDEEHARKCFADYKKCTRIYKEQYEKGKTIERLTVAV